MAGAEIKQFRSALHGFNRIDVVNFVESINSEHEKTVHTLQKENSALTMQAAKLLEENAALASRVAELNDQIAELQRSGPEPEAEPEPETDLDDMEVEAEPADVPSEPTTMELELAAYRRAEAVERGAVQRANALYQQMSDVCAGLNSRMVASDEEICLLYTELAATLDRMKEALADLKLVFDEAPGQILALGGVECDD